ncbi:MAG: hypothetical protein J2P46_05240 [Zavarzinella sp.]|nr:hypothetical protein [Zavarzinella sp.]
MGTQSPSVQPADRDDPALCEADTAAVLEHLISGKPLDPSVVDRVRARAEQVTAGIRRDHGLVDDDTLQSLLDEA